MKTPSSVLLQQIARNNNRSPNSSTQKNKKLLGSVLDTKISDIDEICNKLEV